MDDLVEVKVVSTTAALHFFNRQDVLAEVLTDHDEWAVSNLKVDSLNWRPWTDMIFVLFFLGLGKNV